MCHFPAKVLEINKNSQGDLLGAEANLVMNAVVATHDLQSTAIIATIHQRLI